MLLRCGALGEAVGQLDWMSHAVAGPPSGVQELYGVAGERRLPEIELGLMLSDIDAYADEMLFSIARRLGFGDDLERLVDAGVH